MKTTPPTTRGTGKSGGPQHSARPHDRVTSISLRDPRSTCCETEGPGPRDICIRPLGHFMCRLYVLHRPNPPALGPLEVFRENKFGPTLQLPE